MDYSKDLKLTETNIPGLVVMELTVHGDNRGWFKENWQRQKMMELGLPDFGPVQNNISFNTKKGTTRGIHAEPWDKFISIAHGEVFGAWVDLRPGDTFGQVFTTKLDPSRAIYVPRGVGNSFQTLVDNTAYTYLVNAHWSSSQKSSYTFVNLADPTLNIQWPIPLDEAERSDADLHHPVLADAKPMEPKRTLVTGANGQLGRAIRAYAEAHNLQGFEYYDADTFDISETASYDHFDWPLYGTIINTAAYTAVDKAETSEGRRTAWKTNVNGMENLARVAREHHITLIHISSDYVFDGAVANHEEAESFSPLSVYGQTKAAADSLAESVPRHYILRSSWIVGDGKNFVTRMANFATTSDGTATIQAPIDQVGRLTFAEDIAKCIFTLLDKKVPFGTYNFTGQGPVSSWHEIAERIFEHFGADTSLIEANSVEEYTQKQGGAPRPHHCDLNLSKIWAADIQPANWIDSLSTYLDNLNLFND